MRRYDIITGIILILSIIDFALAAPILAQEKHQARNDWEHILEGVWGEEDTVWGISASCTVYSLSQNPSCQHAHRYAVGNVPQLLRDGHSSVVEPSAVGARPWIDERRTGF